MAKTKRGFIFAAFLVSCGATILAIVSMATENWISAKLSPNLSAIKGNGIVNYGLFFGNLQINPIGPIYQTFSITCECITSDNVCAFSNEDTKEKRAKEINEILSGVNCNKNKKSTSVNLLDFIPDVSVEIFEENKFIYNRTRPLKYIDYNNQINTTDNNLKYDRIKRTVMNYFYLNRNSQKDTIKCDPTFLNMGLYITTLMFLSIGVLIGSITSIITLRNVVGNPVNPWFNIWGLYIWNGVAAVIYLLVLILWSIEFELYIKKNVAIIETLKGQYINDEVGLGYSYWFILVSIFLHGSSCGLFYLRQYLIDKEPEIPDKPDGNTDGMIFVY